MKSKIQFTITAVIMALFVANPLQAQEKTEVTVKITKEGKVVKDTTYQFDNEDQAEKMFNLMEILGKEGEHEFSYEYKMAYSGGDHKSAAVFITRDGEKTEIKEISADSLVWIMKEDGDGEHVHVIRKGVALPDTLHGEHVIISKAGDPEKKVIKVSVSEDGKGNWTIESEEMADMKKDIYIISGDEEDLEIALEKIGKVEGDNVNVVVVKKKKEEEKNQQQ